MRFHFLLSVVSIGSIFPFVSVYADEAEWFRPFVSVYADEAEWFRPFVYVGASVAHNDGYNMNESSGCVGLNGIVDGLHLGYQFNPYLMAEIEYQYLGCAAISEQISGDIRQGVFNTKFGYPLTEKVTPYLKVGASSWVSARVNGLASVIGLGLSYSVFDDVALNLEYQHTEAFSYKGSSELSHERFSLGIMYRFGYAKAQDVTFNKPTSREVIVDEIVGPSPKVEKVRINSTRNQVAIFENNTSILINTQELLSIVALLNKSPLTHVVITGYTSNVGRSDYNQLLSERRAGSAASFLMEQGIDSNRIVTKGKGESDPLYSNDSIEGRAMNRRVAIEFN